MSVYNRFAGHCRNGGGPVEIEMSAYVPADQNVNKAGQSSNTNSSIKSEKSYILFCLHYVKYIL